MKTKGLPVSLNPSNVGIASSETHIIYPAPQSQHFVLEELESGTTNTLEATGSGNPIKFVMGRHSVALMTDSVVLFWDLEGSPLESWNSTVKDIYYEYGNWNLVGPNVVFDPILQDSKSADISVPPKLVYKWNSPVWVGEKTNNLHVGDKIFSLGGPISSIAVVGHYIVMAHGVDITVLFDLKEVGRVEVDEQVEAITGALVDDMLEVYFITPSKVSQITVDLDFEEIYPVDGAQEEPKDVLVSGYFLPHDQHESKTKHETHKETHNTQATSNDDTPPQNSLEPAQFSDPSSDLLALLHKKPAPPRPPSTNSLPGITRESFTPPVHINEDHVSHEDLKPLVKPKIAPLPQNVAKHKLLPAQSADYISRDYFESAVAALSQEIEALKSRVLELEGTKKGKEPKDQSQNCYFSQTPQKPQPFSKESNNQSKPTKSSNKTSASTPKGTGASKPASVADAVAKTLEGQRCLPYLEQHLDELNTYLNGASIERAQLMKLALIHAYHNTKLSTALINNFGPVVVEPSYYNRIIGEEYGH